MELIKDNNKIFYTASPIAAPRFYSPVDIIIPFHGQYDKVTSLLMSIWRFTHGAFHIYLVDDASPNTDFLTSFEKIRGVTGIRSPEQRGYGHALQLGWQQSTSPWLLFMHSDCEIEHINWLNRLGETLVSLKEQRVRMIGPLTNNPLGGDSRQQAQQGQQHTSRTVILEEGMLSSHCFLVHRELFNRCGGFIKNYPYGYYEDQEFAARMRHYGYKQAICGLAWVGHEGEVTFRSVCRKDPKIMQILEENRERCIADLRDLKK